MTDEELRVRAIQELEFYKKDDTFMLADITVDLAIKALEQMPVTTTAGEGGVIYYPQVEGVTPTVIDAGKQEPCDTCGYEEGSIYCKEHCPHEAKMDDLVKLCIEQELRDCKTCIHSDKGHCAGTEKCHECMWENKYEQQPCGETIYRQVVLDAIENEYKGKANELLAHEIVNIMAIIDDVPPVSPTKTGWIPVSERLPEWDIECLVVDDRGEFGVGFYRDDVGAWDSPSWGWLERKDEVDNHDAYYTPCGIGKVVAWMPLPKPYEPQERSDKG